MNQSTRRHGLRWLIPILLIFAWLGLGGTLGPLAGKLGEVVESGAASYLPRDAEATQVLELAKRFGQPEALPAVVVYARDAGLNEADEAAIESDVDRMRATLGEHLAAPPIGPERSDDGRAARVVLLFAGTDETKITPHVQQLRDLVNPGDGRSVHVTGPAGVQADLQDALGAIDLMLLLVTGAIIVVILMLVYRSPILPFLVLAVAGTALGVTQGIIYLLADQGVMSLGSEVQGILSVLVIGAGTDYALLLIARYREELGRTEDRTAAMRRALRSSAGPILASAATVALGLLCLLLSDLGLNRQLGPAAALGIGCAVLAMLTFLPAALVLLGRAAFWPRRAAVGPAEAGQGRVWRMVTRQITVRPRVIWAGTAIVLALMAVGVTRLHADGLSGTDMIIADDVESKLGQRVLAEHYPAGDGSPVLVITQASAVPDVIAAARDVPNVATVDTFPPSATGAPAPPPLIVDGLARVDVVLSVDPDSRAAVAAVRELRTALAGVDGAEAKVGGVTAVKADFDDTAERDRIVIPVLLAVVFLIVLVLVRALVVTVLLLATVVLSFFAAIGVSTVVFQDLLGFPGVDSTFPLHAFVFLVALGIDYNIFLISRVREESQQLGTRAGATRGLVLTGGVITSAGVVLAATFAALGVIPLVLMVELAFTVAFGVLLDTLVVRSLLVPALLVDVGRWVWWPTALTSVRDHRPDAGSGLDADPDAGIGATPDRPAPEPAPTSV